MSLMVSDQLVHVDFPYSFNTIVCGEITKMPLRSSAIETRVEKESSIILGNDIYPCRQEHTSMCLRKCHMKR